MSEHRHFISIWFFIGILLTIYGVLILGSGIYSLIHPPPPDQRVVLAYLHAPIWWGALLLALGGFYTIHFRPKDQ
jgi:hypothetical protein